MDPFIRSLLKQGGRKSSSKRDTSFPILIGSKAEVWHGNARQTKGGIRKSGLMKKDDRIVFKSKSISAKKSGNLAKAGFSTRKGMFGCIKDGVNLAAARHP